MEEIAAELQQRYDLCAIAIHHRTGRVAIGETSVVIAVSAAHRADALAACGDAIDRLKEPRAAVEEGGLRRRRRVDRPGLVGERRDPADSMAAEAILRSLTCEVRPRLMTDDLQNYNPIRPGRELESDIPARGRTAGRRRIALAKYSFVLLKFGSIFIAVGGYALFFGWKFAIGIVAPDPASTSSDTSSRPSERA